LEWWRTKRNVSIVARSSVYKATTSQIHGQQDQMDKLNTRLVIGENSLMHGCFSTWCKLVCFGANTHERWCGDFGCPLHICCFTDAYLFVMCYKHWSLMLYMCFLFMILLLLLGFYHD
jgi:hypothetical protein